MTWDHEAESKDKGLLGAKYIQGWNRALALAMDANCLEPGTPLFVSTDQLQRWSHSMIQTCGTIGIIELLLQYHRYQLIDLAELSNERVWFRYKDDTHPLEPIEVADLDWFSKFTSESQKDALSELYAHEPVIRSEMARLVAPWREHFIQYETTPELDAYFTEYGLLYAQRLSGQDVFDGDSEFGGRPFNLYRATVGVLIGMVLKHLTFCDVLRTTHPTLSPSNLMTIAAEQEKMHEWMSLALDVDTADAREALSMLTLDLNNKDHHLSVPGGPQAPLIQVGDCGVVRSVSGCLGAPFHFMLRELRRRFPGDWDRAVGIREVLFRNELYDIFRVAGLQPLADNLIVKSQLGATDIDAGLFDSRTGILALFQLKWQDPFGNSMRERESRKRNFVENANRWLDVVWSWSSGRAPEEIGRELQLPPILAKRVREVKFFVIGRLFSHFSNVVPDGRAAWGNWAQIVRLVSAGTHSMLADPLRWLDEALRNDAPLKRPRVPLEDLEFEFDGISVVVSR